MNFNQFTKDLLTQPAQKNLSELINDLDVTQISGPIDVGVNGITSDSRSVKNRTLFVALEGEHQDGHRFVQKAIEYGASVVVVSQEKYQTGLCDLLSAAYSQHHQTAVVIVKNTRRAFAHLADRFYDSPSKKMCLIGITGTNGKTTTSFLVKSILEEAGQCVGLIGTLGYRIGNHNGDAQLTTPLPDQLQKLFYEMALARCNSVVMEVSSHSLALERVYGLRFDISLFTNLTQDHLDFHGTLDNYRDAKKLLFDEYTKSFSIFNSDDPVSGILSRDTNAEKMYYGENPWNAIVMQNLALTPSSTHIQIKTQEGIYDIHSRLIGRFNAYNLAAAFAVGYALHIDPAQIVAGLKRIESIRGRFERVTSHDDVTAIIDYSHTPDALQKCLEAIRDIFVRNDSSGKIITVFGCGGDRDRAKRPLMGKIAEYYSDEVIVTSDNPRTEKPQAIIDEILKGVQTHQLLKSTIDRREAIEEAIRSAKPHDVVLIAGKGHETYQIIGDQKTHFDDRELVLEFFGLYHGGVKT